MKQWSTTLFTVLIFFIQTVQAEKNQAVDFNKLFDSINTATSARVVAWHMPNCSFITQDNVSIKQLIDLLKTSHLKQIPDNESFFHQGARDGYEGASYVKLTLNDGSIAKFGFTREYPNDANLDAIVVLPHTQQEITLTADWSMNRDLFAWAVQVGKPQVFLEDIRERSRYELTESDYKRKQSSNLAVCLGLIKENNYYRDPTRYQICGHGGEEAIFYQRHPALCSSGWTDLATTSD